MSHFISIEHVYMSIAQRDYPRLAPAEAAAAWRAHYMETRGWSHMRQSDEHRIARGDTVIKAVVAAVIADAEVAKHAAALAAYARQTWPLVPGAASMSKADADAAQWAAQCAISNAAAARDHVVEPTAQPVAMDQPTDAAALAWRAACAEAARVAAC